jgi:Tfp pilus assembly protein PilF
VKRILALCILSVVASACGGAEPPPDTTPPPITTATATPTATATESVAPPSSPDTGKGIQALQANDLPGAKAAFEAAIAKNGKDADAHHYLGVTLEKTGDKAGAEKEYKAALALRPDLVEAAANLGALYVDAQKWDDAIAVLKGAAQRRGDSSAVFFNLGLALAGKGDQAGATKSMDQALKLAPNDAMLLYTYGHMLAGWHEAEAALVKLKAARDAAGSQADLLGSIGHEMLLIRGVADCITTFDKAIAAKDSAQFRTERALCKMAAKDEAGSIQDLEAAVTSDPKYPLAHYWLGMRRLQQKKFAEAAKELGAYIKLEPNGPKAKTAAEAMAVAKKGGKK